MKNGNINLTTHDHNTSDTTLLSILPPFLLPDLDVDKEKVGLNNSSSIVITDSTENICPLSPYHFAENNNHNDELIKWINYNHLYSLISPYGYVSCFFPTESYLVVGTAKGMILIFDYKEFIKALLVPATQEDAPEIPVRSPVTHIRISEDGTYVGASYTTGEIYLWNLNKTNNDPQGGETIEPIYAVLNIDDHKGSDLSGIDFYPRRHTGIFVSNKTTGTVTFHSGHRTSFWKLSYSSVPILKISVHEKILAMKAQNYDNRVFVAILTNKNLAIINCSDTYNIIFRKKIFAPNQQLGVNYSIAWADDGYKIIYTVNNSIDVIEFSDLDFIDVKYSSHWVTAESICFSKWVSKDLIGILTISHQFEIISPTMEPKIVAKIDLLEQEIVQPPSTHFEFESSKILIFSAYSFKEGKIRSWSEMILNCVQKGDYIHALLLIELFIPNRAKFGPLLLLEDETGKRIDQLMQPFENLAMAAIGYLTRLQGLEEDRLVELFYLILRIFSSFLEYDSTDRFENFIDELLHKFDIKTKNTFFGVLSSIIKDGNIKRLSPECFKELISYLAESNSGHELGEILTQLDPTTLDIDLATRICEENKLFDTLIYIWNKLFNDYMTPLMDFFVLISGSNHDCLVLRNKQVKKEKVFDYLRSILSGLQYPQNYQIFPEETKSKAIVDILSILFSGIAVEWPQHSGNKWTLYAPNDDEPAYPYLTLLLDFDIDRTLRLINQLFESSLLNQEDLDEDLYQNNFSRQSIFEILIDYMQITTGIYNKESVAIFIAFNYPKYPQYLSLSNKMLDNIVTILCEHSTVSEDKVQLGLESLISTYIPSDQDKFVSMLIERGFNDVLLQFYRLVNETSSIIKLLTSSDKFMSQYHESFLDILKRSFFISEITSLERLKVKASIKESFTTILKNVTLSNFIEVLTEGDKSMHRYVFDVDDEVLQYRYLQILFQSKNYKVDTDLQLLHLYIDHCRRGDKEDDIVMVLKRLYKWPKELDDFVDEFRASGYYNALSQYFDLIGDTYSQLNAILDAVTNTKTQGKIVLRDAIGRSIEISKSVAGDNEKYWVKIISTLLTWYGSDEKSVKPEVMNEIQNMLLSVLVKMSEYSIQEEKSGNRIFTKILADSLESQEVLLKRFNDYNELFQNIFRLYDLDETLLSLTLNIILKFSSDDDKNYLNLLKEGWSLSSDYCEICGKKIWGIGLSKATFEIWKLKNNYEGIEMMKKISRDLIIFKCNHGFHKACLAGIGQRHTFHCIICEPYNDREK